MHLFYEKNKKMMQFNTNENVLPVVYDIFYENGTIYCSMKYIEDSFVTLNKYVRDNGVISEHMAVRMMSDICNALASFHGAKILHGNVSPVNIIITPEKTMLAGCDVLQTCENKSIGITYSGYSPYEMCITRVQKGFYTDIHMLGASFYYAVTGKEPLDAVGRMSGKSKVEFEKLLRLSPRFKEILKKCMEFKIEDRYQNVEELLTDLTGLDRDYYANLEEIISNIYCFDGYTGDGNRAGGEVSLVYSKSNHTLYKVSYFYGANCICGDKVISHLVIPKFIRSKKNIMRYAKLKKSMWRL